jgi:two-component system alkaline phosphatase synthesis response regulator PhoP
MSQTLPHKILIVDDQADIIELLEYNLLKEGYQVKTACDGKIAIEIAKDFLPDLIVMDIMMPLMDGVEAASRMRAIPQLTNTFIIFLTARAEEYAEVAAFDIGADDYITKPIKPRALMSRIHTLLKRESNKTQQAEKLTIGELLIDRGSFSVSNKGILLSLPKKEFELLYFLASHPNQVFIREELLQKVWGLDVYVLVRTVDVHIRKIREKIGENYIQTLTGVGYKFNSSY